MKPLIFAFMVLAVVSLAIFASTDVVTLLAGTHTWTEISSAGNTIICTDCHSTIQNELDNSSIHSGLNCEDCHRFTGTGITFASGDGGTGSTPGKEAHAAYTPQCLDCHGAGGYAKQAPAFNKTDYGSNVSAHKPLVKQSLDYDLSVGENEACLACHTNYSIKNVFNRPEYFDFTLEFDHMDLTFTIHEIAGPNTTTISKSDSGAKHEFKAINQIKCEDCHSDVWQAANHTELNQRGLPKASHVYWRWDKSGGHQGGNDPMHNVSYVGNGYENITEYCTLSCHKPTINPSATIPPVFQETAHAAYRVSCYHCHDSTTYTNAFWKKPNEVWDTPEFGRSGKHNDIDEEVLGEKLFLNAETCIACKRDGADFSGGRYITYTEPNNTMYRDSTEI